MIKKIDYLFFGFILISSMLIVAGWRSVESPLQLLLVRVLIVGIISGLIKLCWGSKNGIIIILRNAYPLILSAYFYQETVFYNKVFFQNIDDILMEADSYIFGYQPSVLFSEKLSNMLFSELMYFAYFSFYLLIIGIVLVLYFKDNEKFNTNIFVLTASLYIFYLIFAFLPSEGPQFYFSSPQADLPPAYFFHKIMYLIQEMGEQPTGAFPSSHVGFSVIILVVAFKNYRPFFKAALPIVFLLILATVYLKAHYVVDVLGGLLIAPLVYYFSKLLNKILPGN